MTMSKNTDKERDLHVKENVHINLHLTEVIKIKKIITDKNRFYQEY